MGHLQTSQGSKGPAISTLASRTAEIPLSYLDAVFIIIELTM